MSLTIVLPEYNEAGFIKQVLNEFLIFAKENYFQIFLVNDVSKDYTKTLAHLLADNETLFFVI